MNDTLRSQAALLIETLNQIPGVQRCILYGSLAAKKDDALSDIDIEADVSSLDNGAFALKLPDFLKEKIPIYYVDFAPSLAPEQYVVSVALDEQNPFRIADIRCHADPHINNVSREQLSRKNDPYTHILKLWTINLKHYARNTDCAGDIRRMARKVGIEKAETETLENLLRMVLEWLEIHVPDRLALFLGSCRREWERIHSVESKKNLMKEINLKPESR